MNSETRLLDNLTPIQKNIHGLYNIVVTDKMLTKNYISSLEKEISTCKNFEEINFLRTRIFAIENYRRQRNMEILEFCEIESLDELIKDENGDINYEFYDFIKELIEELKIEKEIENNKLTR